MNGRGADVTAPEVVPSWSVTVCLRGCRHTSGWEEIPVAVGVAPLVSAGVAVVICTYERPESLGRFLESLARQDRLPDQLIIVDAGRSDQAERVLRDKAAAGRCATDVRYVRVDGPLRGLTRQRNQGMRLVQTDLVAFFDDDAVLQPGCLGEMERALRVRGDRVVGAGAYIENEAGPPTLRWRLRALAKIVSNLQPGRYFRSGVSTPWGFLSPTSAWIEGDWLSGCSMWRTAAAREVGFNESFVRYCSGEDLEFSLRMREKGRLVMAGAARVLHLREPSGRLDPYELGFMDVRNHYYIHCYCLPARSWRDGALFQYAALLDLLGEAVGLVWRANRGTRWAYVRGQLAGLVSVLVRPPAVDRKHPAGERTLVQ